MTIREQTEQLELRILSPRAARAVESRGRARREDPCPLRTDFQRDRDRIIHCKSFRRLTYKTQVFIAPEQDHYRTRLTHTLEVAQIARTIARALRLNEDLTEAIALGHDLGHTPFGHAGEQALDQAYRRFDPDARFTHWEQSLRVVEVLENDGRGLNLTWETRDGIARHSKGQSDLPRAEATTGSGAGGASNPSPFQGEVGRGSAGGGMHPHSASPFEGEESAATPPSGPRASPATLEGRVVMFADRIAYINHDIDDALRAGIIAAADLPTNCIQVLGASHSQRITTMVGDLVRHSADADDVTMGDAVAAATDDLKDFLFARVYGGMGTGAGLRKVSEVVGNLFRYYMENPAEVPQLAVASEERTPAPDKNPPDLARRVCDYIAGMTDRYAKQQFIAYFLPEDWRAG
ncbi:MAG TPA: deoxyguanosinetriphosphate triphosphohydrolase family protein [Armatimonadota bacterium]|nr:deoxyguanosinetriphosphate triphosphohydrolase family protein [Armatimonadota bacterium]